MFPLNSPTQALDGIHLLPRNLVDELFPDWPALTQETSDAQTRDPGAEPAISEATAPQVRSRAESRPDNAGILERYRRGDCQLRDVKRVTISVIHQCEGDTTAAEASLEALQRAVCRKTQKNIPPDLPMFNGLIKVYRDAGDLRGAEHCVKRMRQHGVEPDIVTYNTLISAFGNARDLAAAELWFDHLTRDKRVGPDALSFLAIIRACGSEGGKSAGRSAERWFAEMCSQGIKPNARLYSALMFAHCRAGDLGAAANCLTRMSEEHRIAPDADAFNMLMVACRRHGRPQEARRWLDEMVRRGLSPNARTPEALLR